MAPVKPEYEVERIVSDQCLVGRRFFLVKWRGFETVYNTWEPEENLANCPKLVREYFSGKGLPNTKLQKISSTLMRSFKPSKARRDSILTLVSPKPSPRGSRRSSVNLRSNKGNNLQPATTNNVEPGTTNNVESVEANDLQPDEACNSQPAEASDLHPAEASNLQPAKATVSDVDSRELEIEPSVLTETTFSSPSKPSVNSKVEIIHEISANTANSSEKQPDTSSEQEKPLFSLGQSMMIPKIELVRIEDDASITGDYQTPSEFDVKKAELKRLGLLVTERSTSASVNLREATRRVSQRTRRRRQVRDYSGMTVRSSKDTKPYISKIDLTAESTSADETSFSSSQLMSDTDPSWQNSTTVDCKFPNKLQVRLFDQTPRPEVLTTVPFLENFDSDAELELATEDSDKENVLKRRGRSLKRKRGRPAKKLRTSKSDRSANSSRRSEILGATTTQAKDLPKTDDAMVLLTEENTAGGSNLVMYFPRLKLIKSIPQKMADKYYSQAVIDYYRRSMQPQAKVSRRSF
ncbi:hypothetical protein V9T40_000808 [Parthenolecanium corni]|uniref:Chromo domain-containing protein n=1 Tax=Parthenolecanium corni TaxID=536013 RepID=A0AAN9TDM7_9HEMI